MLLIGQLADAAGLTVRTLRHYERVGLLDPACRTNASGLEALEKQLSLLSDQFDSGADQSRFSCWRRSDG
jgi:hypothetical protein